MPRFTEFTPDYLNTPDGVNELNRILNLLEINLAGDTDTVRVFKGFGSPENVIGAGIGAVYLRLDGGTDTTLYRKESGTGSTGWVATSNVSLPLSLVNGGTGQDLSSVNQGDIWYDGGTNGFDRLTPGTSGQFLKTQGAAANPVWATVETPTWSFVASGDWAASSPYTTTFSSLDVNKQYKLFFKYKSRGGTQEELKLRFNGDTGSTYSFAFRQLTMAATPAESDYGNASTSMITIGNIAASGGYMTGWITFQTSLVDDTIITGSISYVDHTTDETSASTGQGGFIYDGASSLTSVTVFSNDATDTYDAEFYLYSIAQS